MPGIYARARSLLTASVCVVGVSWVVMDARAASQSVPVLASETGSPTPHVAVEPPKAVRLQTTYPEAGHGSAQVTLELLINQLGAVEAARVVNGSAPFADAALSASADFEFAPALRDGVPVSARIRLEVKFIPPSNSNPSSVSPAVAETPSFDAATGSYTDGSNVEVVVHGTNADFGAQAAATRTLGATEVRQLAGAFGDALRAIEQLPGMVPLVSGIPYFYVRGAPAGNVGYYIDEVPVPYLFHFILGPSVIQSDLLQSVSVFPGAYPAALGGFAGGIVSGQYAPQVDQSTYRFRVRVLDAGAVVGQPFADGKGHVTAAARVAYPSLALSLINPDVRLRYWDYQLRTSYQLNRNNQVSLSWIGAADTYRSRPSKEDAQLLAELESRGLEEPVAARPRVFVTKADIQFHRLDLRWDQHLETGRLRVAATAGFDRTRIENNSGQFDSPLVGLRAYLDKPLTNRLQLRTGARVELTRRYQHVVDDSLGISGAATAAGSGMPTGMPLKMQPQPGEAAYPLGFGTRWDSNSALFVDAVFQPTKSIRLTPGLRATLFSSGKLVEPALDPRLNAHFQITKQLALVHGLGVAHQPPSFPLPIPGANPTLSGGLQRAIQHNAGFEYLAENLNASLTFFQHTFHKFTDLISADVEDSNSVRYEGHTYGVELFARARLTPALNLLGAYTLSRATQTRAGYHGVAPLDRSHVSNAALSWNITDRWTFGARGIVYSGVPAQYERRVDLRFGRSKPYWRIDWRLEKRWQLDTGTDIRLIAEVLNTTLNEEPRARDCFDQNSQVQCLDGVDGPITLPNLGLEVRL